MKQKWIASLKKPWFWLLLAGSLLILLVLLGRLITDMEQQKLYAEYETYQAQLSQTKRPSDSSSGSGATEPGGGSFPSSGALSPWPACQILSGQICSDQGISSSAAKVSEVSCDSVSVIGRIKIPSIRVDLLLVEGTDAKELRVGAGHFTGSAMPGQKGNCAIAGHRNYTFGSMFNRLGEMKAGNIITIEENKQVFQYRVNHISVVEPSDVAVLNQNKHKRELTLITCTPVRIATHRLIIRAELIAPTDASTSPAPD